MIDSRKANQGDPSEPTSGQAGSWLRTAVLVGLVLLLISLRLVHLGADTPTGLSGSDALYVDEGYKTLSPRNLVLFGTTHWSPVDHYEGWMHLSPITQWSYYLSFRLFGADVEAARYVSVAFLAVFLLSFLWAMRKRYGGLLLLGGLALLGLESTLFFLSRIAVFEFPLITLFYGLLFVFAGMRSDRFVAPVLLAGGIGILLVFGIKVSGLLYLAPVFVGSSLFFFYREDLRRPWVRSVYATVVVLVLALFLLLTRHEWVGLLKFEFLETGTRMLDNPLVHRSPAPILAGMLCALHLLVCRPDLCRKSLYRINLVAVVLLGIPLVALFEYDPLRYYSPLLPAFLLIVFEWIHLRGWSFPPPRPSAWVNLTIFAGMVPWSYYAIGLCLLYRPVPLFGDDPSLGGLAVVVVVATLLWAIRSVAFRGAMVAAALLLFLAVFLAYNAHNLGSFLLRPTFQSQQIRADLLNLLPEDSVLGGVWAPFYALGTPFKTLYIAAEGNYPERLPELAPDYIVLSRPTGNSKKTLMRIRVSRGMDLGPLLYAAIYNEKRTTVHPLFFDPRLPLSRLRGPHVIGRSLLRIGELQAAERSLRIGLELLESDPAADPAWLADARSDWGASMARLGYFAEAEEALLGAYRAFDRGGEAPARVSARRTLERLVELYQAWNKGEQLARYRRLLEGYEQGGRW
jgi:hypothetical protein